MVNRWKVVIFEVIELAYFSHLFESMLNAVWEVSCQSSSIQWDSYSYNTQFVIV